MKSKTSLIDMIPVKTSRISDYLTLCKLGLLKLVLLTTGMGYFLASRAETDLLLLFHVILGTCLTGSGAHALNQWYERKSDALMGRTKDRPLPAGRLSSEEALLFGIIISFLGILYLSLFVNSLTAVLGALSWASYVFLYTPLKKYSIWNTWVGAIPGAIPPLMGWTAAEGTITAGGWTLFAILFIWQIPHFLALAWKYRDEYKAGGLRMLPCLDTDGKLTPAVTLIHGIALLNVAFTPYFFGMGGLFYLVSSLLLSLWFIYPMIRFAQDHSDESARKVFILSILYLPLLLICLAVGSLLPA